jgi:hypothetical protein
MVKFVPRTKKAHLRTQLNKIMAKKPKSNSPLDAATCSPSSVRAFRVVTDYFDPPEATIIRTTTAARAKHRCWDSAHDAGYAIKWASLKVRRAPEYDAAKLIKDRCYGEDFARSILPENNPALTPASHVPDGPRR